jgi:KaiC/GvpD/RAD55 family RecA-like ATPase
MANEDAERQYLAGLLDVLDESPLEARELVSLVESVMFVADGAAAVHAAIRRVLEAESQPTRADVLSAIGRTATADGIDRFTDPVRHLFLELVADELATGRQASRRSAQAAAEVAELYRRRRGVELAADYVLRLRHGGGDGLSRLVEEMESVRLAGPARGVVTFAEAVDEWARHERVPTVQTLLEPFDRATEGGLPIGGLTMLVAPPQCGKTALAVQLALGALLADADVRVVYGLGEMSSQSFARRMACVGASLLGHPRVTMADAGSRSRQARETLGELVAAIGDRLSIVPPPLTVDRLDEQVQRTGAKLLVVDYLQLVLADGDSRVEQLDRIVGGVRDLTIRRSAAGLVISSMAKATGEGSRIGQFARGTGEADYAAELVYLGVPDEREDEDGTRGVRWQCKKARNLPQVDVELRFDGAIQTFSGAVEPWPEFAQFGSGR